MAEAHKLGQMRRRARERAQKMGNGDGTAWETGGMLSQVRRADGKGKAAFDRRSRWQRAWRRKRQEDNTAAMMQGRKADRWQGREWRPGKRTMERAVRDLVFEALDPVAWISCAELLARLPATVKPMTVRAFMSRDAAAGKIERQAFTVHGVFEKRPVARRRYRYRLTRLGELYRARRRQMESPAADRGASGLKVNGEVGNQACGQYKPAHSQDNTYHGNQLGRLPAR